LVFVEATERFSFPPENRKQPAISFQRSGVKLELVLLELRFFIISQPKPALIKRRFRTLLHKF
jgi:hypothetical protein